jgi:hypothetical protein
LLSHRRTRSRPRDASHRAGTSAVPSFAFCPKRRLNSSTWFISATGNSPERTLILRSAESQTCSLTHTSQSDVAGVWRFCAGRQFDPL